MQYIISIQICQVSFKKFVLQMEMTMESTFLSVFYDLLAEKGLNRKQFAEKSGIPYPTVIGWTNLKRMPDYYALIRIADFFSCTLDYLTGREGDSARATAAPASDEERLLRNFRRCSDENKTLLLTLSEKLTAPKR